MNAQNDLAAAMLIASCNGENCTIKDTCQRYTSKPVAFEDCLSILDTSKNAPFDGCGHFVNIVTLNVETKEDDRFKKDRNF